MTNIEGLKIIFLGTPEIAATVLKSLLDNNYPIVSVVTRPDKPSGRSAEPQQSPVKVLAAKNNLTVFQPANKIELEEYIVKMQPDLLIVCAFGMIVTEPTIEAADKGAINVHPSLLPAYRGPAPISAPILAGDKKTGTTIMLMSAGMDEGDILAQTELPLTGTETTPLLTERLANLSAKLLLETLPSYIEGQLRPVPQNTQQATYTKMVKKEDGRINWQKDTAAEVERKSRAYSSWPGSYTEYNGKKIDLYGITLASQKLKPGETSFAGSNLLVGTAEGSVAASELKLEGKNKVAAADFIRGYPDITSSVLK